MNLRLPRLAMMFLISCAATAQDINEATTNEVVRLRVTVVSVEPIRGFAGIPATVGDVVPRFALTVRLDSCVPAITNLKIGRVVTLAVHSPSMFLGGDAKNGETREITMARKKAANLVSHQEDQPVTRRPVCHREEAFSDGSDAFRTS